MFDLGFEKLLVIGVLALFLVGPDKLPHYAAQLARWVRVVRSLTDDAKRRVATEMGPEFEDLDWDRLDPRRYTPRRLLVEAWNAPAAAPSVAAPSSDDDEPDLLLVAERRAEGEQRADAAQVGLLELKHGPATSTDLSLRAV